MFIKLEPFNEQEIHLIQKNPTNVDKSTLKPLHRLDVHQLNSITFYELTFFLF